MATNWKNIRVPDVLHQRIVGLAEELDRFNENSLGGDDEPTPVMAKLPKS